MNVLFNGYGYQLDLRSQSIFQYRYEPEAGQSSVKAPELIDC